MKKHEFEAIKRAATRLTTLVEEHQDKQEAIIHLINTTNSLKIYNGEKKYDYKITNGIVDNLYLKEIKLGDPVPKYIIIGDNPGCEEQKESRYLFGSSGERAASWFQTNLNISLHKEAIVLNKTPIHSKATDDLRNIRLLANNNELLSKIFTDLQKTMATIAWDLVRDLNQTKIWICGSGELKNIFKSFAIQLHGLSKTCDQELIMLFHHFARHRFHNQLINKNIELPKTREDQIFFIQKLESFGHDNWKQFCNQLNH